MFRWILFLTVALLGLSACDRSPETRTIGNAQVPGSTKPKIFQVKGVVISVKPKEKSIEIKHEEIPGYMPAMTMGFRTASPKIVESVKVGDAVRFTLRGTPPNLAITAIEKTAP